MGLRRLIKKFRNFTIGKKLIITGLLILLIVVFSFFFVLSLLLPMSLGHGFLWLVISYLAVWLALFLILLGIVVVLVQKFRKLR